VNKQALLILTRATELFISDLAGVCGQIAKMNKRKVLQVNDVISAASNIDKFHFIKDSKLPALNPRRAEEANTH
jgi:histone H3/H4